MLVLEQNRPITFGPAGDRDQQKEAPMRFRFLTTGRVLVAIMLGTAVTALAAYDASGTWEGELCGRGPGPGNECTGIFQVVFTQDADGNLTGDLDPLSTFTATLRSTSRRFLTYDMQMVDLTSCLALTGTVRINTTTNTMTGNLAGTHEDCTDTRPLSGTVALSRISGP
jgi:heme A synthase